MSKNLATLVASCPGLRLSGGPDGEVHALTADSRVVEPGVLFAALRGTQADGTRFIVDALDRGASAILHDGATRLPEGHGAVELQHPEPRLALALLAAAFYGHPDRRLTLIGVTGTNGKTTVTGMIAALLAAGGRRPGVIGTTGIFFAGQQWPNPLTTPDPIALHRYLSVMVESGCDSVVMEVSSHALMQHRTAGLSWAAAAFTNLSHDHLDYHGGLEAYFEAKCQLFVRERPAMAVLPLGDSHGRRLAAMCASDCRIIGFGLPETEDASGPHDLETDAGINLPPEWVAAHSVRCTWAGSDMMWRAPGLPTAVPLHVSVPGRLNVDNALCASAVAWGLGVAVADIQRGLASFQAPPGRLERIIAGQPFTVAVDFAHTPEALSKLLESVRPLTSHRIIVVFGCGGDRDPGKRAIMGAVAAVRADVAIITDDNPRGEPPWAIRRAIMDGAAHVANGAETLEMPGRGQAIETALAIARPGDTVLIAGKGHETVQISASGTRPFSDVEVARGALLRLGHGQS